DGAAVGLEERERVLAAQERAVEVDRHHALPGRVVGVLDGGKHRDPGGVDEAVEPSGGAPDLADDAEPVVLRRDVERVVDAGSPGEIGRDRAAAFAPDRLPDRRTDGAGGAG